MTEEEVRRAERSACADIARAAAKEAERVGLMHPEESPSRDRMFARAREAYAIAVEIENRT